MIGSFMTRKRWLLAGTGAAVSLVAIACGSDPGAAGGDETPSGQVPTAPPSSNTTMSGYDSVRQSLQADGAVVVRGEAAETGIFKNPYTEVLLNGESIQVYEFPNAGAATTASATVSSDGTIISHEAGAPAVAIDFQNPPHYFQHDNVIVVYTGDDAGTVAILREKLGEEFAGDKGAVGGSEPGDSGTTPQADYDTVSAPAPIEAVKVGIDPNNPNGYILYVTSGLPGGCASFEDASIERADDFTFNLKVTNLIPAPDEMVACTMIYGIVEHEVAIGTVGEELAACEVYTVNFMAGEKAESVQFQAVAENVRCADPGLAEDAGSYSGGGVVDPGRPNDGGGESGNGGFPQTIISDVQALLMALERMGIKAEWSTGDESGSNLLGFDSDIITINGQRVDVWVFAPGESAWDAAHGISQDGYSINVPGAPMAEVMWISTPHFYLFGNTIVLYVGVDEEITGALGSVGVNFAGPGSQPLDKPIPVEPDGGIGDTPIPVEPDGGIGDGGQPIPVDQPIPVEPDGGIGDGGQPIPVEPDGGIGDGAGLPADPDRPVSSDDPAVGEPDPDTDWDTVLEPAPVISVGEVVVAESFPVQYFLSVRTAQPDGCHKDAGYEVKVDGTNVYVTVSNSVPENLAVVMCTMIYGETEQSVKLGNGNDFESGVEYTVIVNGEVERTFTAE